jgi:hypothetical protein
MGSPSATGGGRTDAGPNRTTAYKAGVGSINEKGKKTPLYKSDNPDAFRNRGAEKIKKGVKTPSLAVNVGAAILSKPLQAGSKMTRDFFRQKVLGSKNYKGTTKTEFDSMSRSAQESMYKSYITGRTSGKTDAYGNPISQGDNGGATSTGGQVVQAPTVTAPTTAEVSQTTTAEAKEDDILLRKRKAKAKGRSPTIMTGVTGVDGSLTLGKPSLLGS